MTLRNLLWNQDKNNGHLSIAYHHHQHGTFVFVLTTNPNLIIDFFFPYLMYHFKLYSSRLPLLLYNLLQLLRFPLILTHVFKTNKFNCCTRSATLNHFVKIFKLIVVHFSAGPLVTLYFRHFLFCSYVMITATVICFSSNCLSEYSCYLMYFIRYG